MSHGGCFDVSRGVSFVRGITRGSFHGCHARSTGVSQRPLHWARQVVRYWFMRFYRKTRRSPVVPGAARELTFSCYHRLPLLRGDTIKKWFVDNLDEARKELGLEVWAYVLMPEHVHLLVFPLSEEFTVPKVLARIKQPIAHRALTALRARSSSLLEQLEERRPDGSSSHRFWQRGGGYDRIMDSSKVIANSIEYCHQNPVKRGLVETCVDWKWSSCRQLEGVESDIPIRVDVARL